MNWGIIGAGNIAGKFAQTINRMNQSGEKEKLIAVAARDLQRAEQFASVHQIGQAFGSYEELLQSGEVDAVYIATPNNLHYEHTKLCLAAGKHVLCEKPFTTKAQEAEELYELAEKRGLFVMEAFWIRFLPVLLKMQEIIAGGEIGEVKYMRSDYGFIAAGARRERKFDAALGGGALLDIGIYNLGFLNMVMGKNPCSFSSSVHLNEFGTDDFSVITLGYGEEEETSETVGVVTTSIGLNIQRRAAVVGTKGTIELPDFQKAECMRVTKNDGTAYEIKQPFDYTGFEYEVREVSRCVLEGRSSSDRYTPQMSLETLHLMDDIRESWDMHFPFEL